MAQSHDVRAFPYKIAVLCYLYDPQGRLLLLHRRKPPNSDKYSPIGGKLEIAEGESPHDCARREVWEEAGVRLEPNEIRLLGLVSEAAFEGEEHWLIFLFEVTRAIRPEELAHSEFDEGRLEWHAIEDVARLPIPETDQRILWPAVQKHKDGFFALHIDCRVTPHTSQMHESWTHVSRA